MYTIRNNDTTDRTVLIEHPRRPGWTLVAGLQAVETSETAYRFKVAAPAKQTTTLTVEEKQPVENKYQISSLTDEQLNVMVRNSGDNGAVKQALQPILAKKASMAALSAQLADRQGEIQQISEDEARIRENLRAVKGTAEENRLVKRYAAQLTEWDRHASAGTRGVGPPVRPGPGRTATTDRTPGARRRFRGLRRPIHRR